MATVKLGPPRAAFRIPSTWEQRPSDGTPQPLSMANDAGSTSNWAIKAAVIFALISLTVLDRFGLRLSEAYSINPALVALYGLAFAMLLSGAARLNPVGAMSYVLVLAFTGISYLVNVADDTRDFVSIGSLMLLLVLYAPVVLSLSKSVGKEELWLWVMKWYVRFTLFIAVAGILQFYAQFVISSPWLFDYREMIPPIVRGSGLYNTLNPAGSLIKSNGFFLREASGFSFLLAFGILCELNMRRRKLPIAVMALGILVSYSGSGFLALGVAMLFQASKKLVLQLACGLAIGAVVVSLFGDALNLQYTLGRVGEFDSASTKSSAYCRFISPGKLAVDQIDSTRWSALVGHGPGTTQKMFDACETTYGKIVFEYGLLGALALSVLIFAAVMRSRMPLRLRVMLIVQWYLLGGHLLAPEPLLVIFVLSSMWPEQVGKSLPLPAEEGSAAASPGGLFSSRALEPRASRSLEHRSTVRGRLFTLR